MANVSVGSDGLLVLVGVRRDDTEPRADRLLERLLQLPRVFADEAGKMNLSLLDTGGGLLLVPQFTLAADTRGGVRFLQCRGLGTARICSTTCGGRRRVVLTGWQAAASAPICRCAW